MTYKPTSRHNKEDAVVHRRQRRNDKINRTRLIIVTISKQLSIGEWRHLMLTWELTCTCWYLAFRNVKHSENRWGRYDFLLPFHSNYGHILYCFPHILVKIVKFIYPTCIKCPVRGGGIVIWQMFSIGKTRITVLPYAKRKYDDTIREHDKWRDKWMDRIAESILCEKKQAICNAVVQPIT